MRPNDQGYNVKASIFMSPSVRGHSHLPQRSADSAVDLHQHRDRNFSISAETQLSTAAENLDGMNESAKQFCSTAPRWPSRPRGGQPCSPTSACSSYTTTTSIRHLEEVKKA